VGPMITSPDNPTVKQARALMELKGRREQGRCLVEGVRLIEEAMRAGTSPALIFFLDQARDHARSAQLLQQAAEIIELSPKVFATLTDTVTSQGMIAVISTPRVPAPPVLSFVLLLDQLRDPGNLGTILRSAEAAGVEKVVLTPGCVDPWNPKVLRSGMGAHFRLAIQQAARWQEVAAAISGLPLWIAEAAGAAPYDSLDWTSSCALGIGSEAAGFSQEVQDLANGRVAIPMAGPVESLNAAMAATVLMFEVARQRRQEAKGRIIR
jgi:RNA methyltransferase, TrmH family